MNDGSATASVTEGRRPAPSVRAARGWIREWRHLRAGLRWSDVLEEGYVRFFCAAVILAMAGSVLRDLSSMVAGESDDACASVRDLTGWFVLVGSTWGALSVARVLGPVSSPPAANTWLLSTPIDRGSLLRPLWWRAVATAALTCATLAGLGVALTRADLVTTLWWATAAAGLGVCVLSVAAVSQLAAGVQEGGGGFAARRLSWFLALLLCAGAGSLLLDARAVGTVARQAEAIIAWVAGTLLVGAALAAWGVAGRLGRFSRGTLGRVAHLPAALGGALASLDLGLVFDVLLARRWSGNARVRSRRGGPYWWFALVHREFLRVGRQPQPFAALGVAALLVHQAAGAGLGRAVVLVAICAGFLVGPSLATGLRVVMRTPSIASMMPMSDSQVRGAHVVVPALAMLLYGAAVTPAFVGLGPWWEVAAMGLACGLGALAATVRWVAAGPPDYASPMLATPAGAVPPGVVAGLARGWDVCLVTAVPLLIEGWGPWSSLVIASVVLWWVIEEG